LVGRVLAQAESAPGWHRVLNAQGKCAFAPGSEGYQRQVALLAGDGISPVNGRFPLVRLRWPAANQASSPLLD
jgi:alkylated DNA nucleotide flippase Atl1